MDIKIAVFTNNDGITENMGKEGHICFFEKKDDVWQIYKKEAFSPGTGIVTLRKDYTELADMLDGCRIFVAKVISGLAFNVMDRKGIHLWEFEGRPEAFLDQVARGEKAYKKELEGMDESGLVSYYVKKDEGKYAVDVHSLMKENGDLTSKKILKPFFKTKKFYELEAIFDHIPPWLYKELEGFGLTMDVLSEGNGKSVCLIRPAVCDDSI